MENVPANEGWKLLVRSVKLFVFKPLILVPFAIVHVYAVVLLNPVPEAGAVMSMVIIPEEGNETAPDELIKSHPLELPAVPVAFEISNL